MKNGNIILRYIKEDDIESYIRWTTVETEWVDWDDPWEDDDWDDFVEQQRTALREIPSSFSKLEIETDAGRHIGWVSSYKIEGIKERIAVGIDIPPVDARRNGYGESALSLFIAYLFNNTDHEYIYTQTWSGNIPMLNLAEKIGFVEIERIINIRQVGGRKYNALTLSISREAFFNMYPNLKA